MAHAASPKMKNELYDRTKSFALRIINLYSSLPKTTVTQVLGKQLLRSGTSVGAHYREARRARSRAEFISKIEGGLQELEETIYWLELLLETAPGSKEVTQAVRVEAEEILAIMIASAKTAKLRH